MLDLSAARDGLAAYYALHHDPARTRLFVEEEGTRVKGFMAVCQTGQDLFRQMVVLRARSKRAAAALLQRGLEPHRPYYLVTTLDLYSVAEEYLALEEPQINRIYRLSLSNYTPATINVLVIPSQAADGSRRFVVRAQDRVVAESGTNWRSPHYAEVYVWVSPEARKRGWGRAALSSTVAWVVRSGLRPLYVVSEDNAASIHLAEATGFVDTHAREFTANAMVLPEEA
jgi:RimJ/RimL family protein N-acetyltransferase